MSGIGDLNEHQNERMLISKMLGNHTVDFLWNGGSEWTGWPSRDNKTTIFNRFSRASFTSKVNIFKSKLYCIYLYMVRKKYENPRKLQKIRDKLKNFTIKLISKLLSIF